jgi:hypothetical protein
MSVRVWVLGSGELEADVMQEENERLARRLPHFLAGLY